MVKYYRLFVDNVEHFPTSFYYMKTTHAQTIVININNNGLRIIKK